ncbi:MAG TPA: hypothetical protein VEJ84_19540, partial [Acidimicrobiales bacterium]|nr:hypothetical protein [Acidimicrobiales bacterium]
MALLPCARWIVLSAASINLIVELGVMLAVLLAWQFTLAEFVAGPIMIVLVAAAFLLLLHLRLLEDAPAQALKGRAGSMEGQPAGG